MCINRLTAHPFTLVRTCCCGMCSKNLRTSARPFPAVQFLFQLPMMRFVANTRKWLIFYDYYDIYETTNIFFYLNINFMGWKKYNIFMWFCFVCRYTNTWQQKRCSRCFIHCRTRMVSLKNSIENGKIQNLQ